MMKKVFLSCILGSLLVTSCKKEDKSYTGSVLLEFGKTEVNQTMSFVQADKYKVSIPVQLIGVTQASDVTAEISIQSTDSLSVEGKQFSYTHQVVIPAGSLSANLEVLVDPKEVTSKVALKAQITDASSIKASENYKVSNIVVNKQVFIDYFTGSYQCTEPDYQNSTYSTVFYKNGAKSNSIYTLNFINFAGDNQKVYFDLSNDASRVINIPNQKFIDKALNTYTLSGSGTYDADGGMKITYDLSNEDDVISGTVIYKKK